jgi:hypothetical protein
MSLKLGVAAISSISAPLGINITGLLWFATLVSGQRYVEGSDKEAETLAIQQSGKNEIEELHG